jgi:hypothetical protein
MAVTMDKPDLVERWAVGFHDHLQYPLQPLQDNLVSNVYEHFEKGECHDQADAKWLVI